MWRMREEGVRGERHAVIQMVHFGLISVAVKSKFVSQMEPYCNGFLGEKESRTKMQRVDFDPCLITQRNTNQYKTTKQ